MIAFVVTLVAIAMPSLAALELSLRGQQPPIPRACAKDRR